MRARHRAVLRDLRGKSRKARPANRASGGRSRTLLGRARPSRYGVPPEIKKVRREVDIRTMKRRLVGRDRLAWLVALIALGVVLYLVLPLWVLLAAVLMVLGVP